MDITIKISLPSALKSFCLSSLLKAPAVCPDPELPVKLFPRGCAFSGIQKGPNVSNHLKLNKIEQRGIHRQFRMYFHVNSCKFMQVIMVSQNLRLVYNNCLFWCFLIRLCSELVDYVFFYQLIKLELDIGSLQGLYEHFLNLYSLRFYDYIKTAAIMNHVRYPRRRWGAKLL